ncbi:MAG: hypothetical protein AAGD04_08970 [Pseudomonadota bacterium]
MSTRALNVVGWGLGFVLVVYALFWSWTGLRMAIAIQDVVAEQTQSFDDTPRADIDATKDPSFPKIALYSESGRALKPAQAVAVLAPTKLSKKRVYFMEEVVPFSAILDPGETPPQGDLLELMARIRSEALAKANCDRIKRASIATCALNWHGVSDVTARSFMLKTSLLYSWDDPLGTLPDTEQGMAVQDLVRLDPIFFDPLDTGGLTQARAKALDRVEAFCAEYRKTLGNCVPVETSEHIGNFRRREAAQRRDDFGRIPEDWGLELAVSFVHVLPLNLTRETAQKD